MTGPRDYRAALDFTRPMASARYVRRDVYAWPGGYALALLCDDGETLCPQCVAENFAEISAAHRDAASGGGHNGWKPAGVSHEHETDAGEWCAHCGRCIWPDKVDGAAEAAGVAWCEEWPGHGEPLHAVTEHGRTVARFATYAERDAWTREEYGEAVARELRA